MSVFKWIIAFILAILTLVGLTVGAWQLGWIFTNANVNRTAHLYQNSYGTNIGLVQTIDNQMNDLQNIKVELTQVSANSPTYTALQGQERAIRQSTCSYIGRLTIQLPADIQQFHAVNCN